MMNCKHMCSGHMVSWVLVLVGAINWGLVGVGYFAGANWNIVNLLVGRWPQVEAVVYFLVGAAAVMMLFKEKCKMCQMEMKKS